MTAGRGYQVRAPRQQPQALARAWPGHPTFGKLVRTPRAPAFGFHDNVEALLRRPGYALELFPSHFEDLFWYSSPATNTEVRQPLSSPEWSLNTACDLAESPSTLVSGNRLRCSCLLNEAARGEVVKATLRAPPWRPVATITRRTRHLC